MAKPLCLMVVSCPVSRPCPHTVLKMTGSLGLLGSLRAAAVWIIRAQLVAACCATGAQAETVCVKYGDCLALDAFKCVATKGSFVHRVCYDAANEYMLIKLRRTYYHYCQIPPDVVAGLLQAPSKGRFYNRNIKGWGRDGPYDCRTHRIPNY
jgi:hypothetical protein